MALGDWLSGIFGGGSSSGVDPAMGAINAGIDQSGFSSSASDPGMDAINTAIGQTADPMSVAAGGAGAGGSSGVNAASIAKALNSISAGLKTAEGGDSKVPQPGPAATGSARSEAVQGSAGGMNALVQMLMQNQNKYFPGGPNTQPVAQGRSAGLLGF